MGSLVLNGLFWMPLILLPARTVEGAITALSFSPVAAAAPASPAAARNWRRFRYSFFGVISDERMSSAFLISMKPPLLKRPHKLMRYVYLPPIGRRTVGKVSRIKNGLNVTVEKGH